MKGLKTRKKLFLTLATVLFLFGGSAFYWAMMRRGFLMPLTVLPAVLCLPNCPAEAAVHPFFNERKSIDETRPLSEILGQNVESERISILIEKSQYRLTVFYDLQPIKSYPVVFGGNPSGDKRYEGDRKTPEGIFRVRDLYEHPSWSKFIWLDYPTARSWRKHFQAKFAGEINPAHSIGGQIGIHGVPAGEDSLIEERSNWTLGCISLNNRDVNELFGAMKVGTLVEILP